MATSVDVIYVNYFSASDVIDSILSLKSLFRSCHIKANVYIVDNSFTEGSPDQARHLLNLSFAEHEDNFRIIYQPSDSNLGFGAACNKAASIGSSDIILFANCDTTFAHTNPRSFLNSISLFKDPTVSVIGPRVLDENRLLHASCFSFDPISILLKPLRHVRKLGSTFKIIFPRYKFFKKQIDRITYEGMDKNKPCIVDWVSGCFMFVRRDFFYHVGGFDTRYFLYFEDVDLCRKARQLGTKVLFDPMTSVTHLASHQSARGKGVLRSLMRNKTSRMHLSSWLKYCFKWREDFWRKSGLFVSRLFRYNRSHLKLSVSSNPSYSYVLDFSLFATYERANEAPSSLSTNSPSHYDELAS